MCHRSLLYTSKTLITPDTLMNTSLGIFSDSPTSPAPTRQQHIPANSPVLAAAHSANHDEAVFNDPDTFRIERREDETHSLAFGCGIRRCVVEWLARAELEGAFGTFLVEFIRSI